MLTVKVSYWGDGLEMAGSAVGHCGGWGQDCKVAVDVSWDRSLSASNVIWGRCIEMVGKEINWHKQDLSVFFPFAGHIGCLLQLNLCF